MRTTGGVFAWLGGEVRNGLNRTPSAPMPTMGSPVPFGFCGARGPVGLFHQTLRASEEEPISKASMPAVLPSNEFGLVGLLSDIVPWSVNCAPVELLMKRVLPKIVQP